MRTGTPSKPSDSRSCAARKRTKPSSTCCDPDRKAAKLGGRALTWSVVWWWKGGGQVRKEAKVNRAGYNGDDKKGRSTGAGSRVVWDQALGLGQQY